MKSRWPFLARLALGTALALAALPGLEARAPNTQYQNRHVGTPPGHTKNTHPPSGSNPRPTD